MTTTPTFWGNLGRVNSGDVGPTGDDQYDGVVTALANGNFLVAYTDDSNSAGASSGLDIVGRLYDPEGQPLGASFQLNTYRTVDDENNAEIAALSDGGFVMVYEDDDAAGTSLVYQRYDASGLSVASGAILNDPGADVLSQPRVAVFPDDSFVVTYTREIGGNDNVRAKVVSSTGTVGAEIPVRSHPDDPRAADVAVLGNGNFVVTFVEDDGSDQKLEFSIFTAAGAPQLNSNIVSPGTVNEDPQVVALDANRFLIVWSDETDFENEQIYGRIYSNGGADLSGLLNLATNGDDDTEPAIAPLDDGGFILIYDQDFVGEAIRGRRFDADGNPVGSEFTVEATQPLVVTPEVALLSDGRFVVTWDNYGTSTDVFGRIYDPRETLIVGTTGNDVLTGRREASTVSGLGGNDTLFGVSGDDTLYGGSGQDDVYGRTGDDLVVDSDALSADHYDGGSGYDTIDYGAIPFFDGVTIDLQSGLVTFDGGFADLAVNFEAGVAGGDADLLGNAANNELFGAEGGNNGLFGRSGDDLLRGLSGADSLFGGVGLDDLDGGSGDDAVYGDAGADTAFGDAGDDRIRGGSGHDFLGGRVGDDRLAGGSGDDSLYGAGGSDTAFGDLGQDRLEGLGGADRLYGGLGNDSLDGGSALDSLFGGSGSDRMVVGPGEAQDGETYDGGSGTDVLTVHSAAAIPAAAEFLSIEYAVVYGTSAADSIAVAIPAGAVFLFGESGGDDLRSGEGGDTVMAGSGDDVARGQAGDDRLVGHDGADTLLGANGDDTAVGDSGNDRIGGGSGSDWMLGEEGRDRLNGGSGVDTAAGGAADDTVVVDTEADLVLETAGGGLEDQVRSNALNYSLGSGVDGFVERAHINQGIGDADLRGNDLDNILLGNRSANRLFAFSGDDTLNGRSGVDILTAGSGDDTFVVDTVGDQVRDFDGQGTDLVRSRVGYTLPDGTANAFVENLRLEGGGADIDGGGNALDNSLEGNRGSNELRGYAGADRLFGALGDDTLFGGQHGDRLEGSSGADTLYVGEGDTLFGGSGGDWFRFNGNPTGSGGSGGPVIRDFDGVSLNAANGADKLVFATGVESGSFAYIGGAAFSGGGDSEARYAGTRQVQVDQDGDGAADVAFLVDGLLSAGGLTATDFVWL